MALKLDRLTQRIADQNRIDTALLMKNDRIGKNSRPRVNVVKKNLTGVDEEILKEYEQITPQTYEFVDEAGQTKFRKYQLPNIKPELQEIDVNGWRDYIPESFYKDVLRETEGEQAQALADIKKAEADLKKNLNMQKQTIRLINEGELQIVSSDELNVMGKTEFAEKQSLNRELQDLKYEEQAIRNYIRNAQQRYQDADAFIQQLKTDYVQINSEIKKIKQSNLERANMYRDELNFLNKGAFSTEKADNESEMEYLERLQRNAELLAPEDQLQDAKVLTINKFREKMRELIQDPVKIEQVINSLDSNSPDDVDDKANLLKSWSQLKSKFIATYGINNKRITADDILLFFNFFLKKGESGLPLSTETALIALDEPLVSSAGGSINLEVQPYTSTNTLAFIHHTAGGDKDLYLRSLIDGNNKILLYSFTGLDRSYVQFFDTGVPSYRKSGREASRSSVEIERRTGITPQMLNNKLGISISSINPTRIVDKMFEKYQIQPISLRQAIATGSVETKKYSLKKGAPADEVEYGMGVPSNGVPQYVHFGDVILLLQKLYNHNQLSVKNRHLKQVQGFRTVKVSEMFVKLIMNMLKGLKPTHSDIMALPQNERIIYDRLIKVSNLSKEFTNQGEKTVADLKNRLKMIEAEMEIGNNNPLLKKEMYGVLHALKNFKVVTQSQINEYLKQF